MLAGLALVLAAAKGGPWSQSGFSWWQAIGGTAVVLALLVGTLRLLGRWQRARPDAAAALLAVIPLGARREVQVVRLGEDVHFIYRCEGSLLLLNTQSYQSYRVAKAATALPHAAGAAGWFDRLLRVLSPFSRRGQQADGATIIAKLTGR